MGSKDRMPPNLRTFPGPGMMQPDAFFPDPHPPGPFFDALPPPEIMEQNLARQHMEMQKLAVENERLATTHSGLRQALIAAQQELQRLDTQVATAKAEKEKQMRVLLDRMAKMEATLQSFEPLKVELQQSRMEVEKLVASRQELISKVQQLTQGLEKSRADVQQVPALLSELDGLRREYQNCRVTYDRERKLHNDHLESLQVMEKNYVSMSREVENLRAELGHYGSSATFKTSEARAMQNVYYDGYGSSQGQGPPQSSLSPYGGRTSGPTSAQVGCEVPRGPSHDTPKATDYDASRGPRFDDLRESGHNRGGAATYDTNRAGSLDANAYDAPRGAPGYDASQGAPAYDAQRANYDSRRGASGYDVQQAVGYGGSGSRDAAAYEYEAFRAPTGYDHPRHAGYNDPRSAAGVRSLGYNASRSGGHTASGGAGHNIPGASNSGVPRAAGGTGYQVPPAASEYDAPGGSDGGRHPAYTGSYGSIKNPNLTRGAPYQGANSQHE